MAMALLAAGLYAEWLQLAAYATGIAIIVSAILCVLFQVMAYCRGRRA
jgi:hypothetical protein